MLDTAPSKDYENKIRTVARSVEGVIDIEKCFIRKSGLHRLIDIHVKVNGDLSVWEGHEIAHRIKDTLLDSEYGVADVLVHIEPHLLVKPNLQVRLSAGLGRFRLHRH